MNLSQNIPIKSLSEIRLTYYLKPLVKTPALDTIPKGLVDLFFS